MPVNEDRYVWANPGDAETNNETNRIANAWRRVIPRIRDGGRVIGTVSPGADSLECIFLVFRAGISDGLKSYADGGSTFCPAS
jgi:hypothetical protein